MIQLMDQRRLESLEPESSRERRLGSPELGPPKRDRQGSPKQDHLWDHHRTLEQLGPGWLDRWSINWINSVTCDHRGRWIIDIRDRNIS